jgi:phosphate transport system protein
MSDNNEAHCVSAHPHLDESLQADIDSIRSKVAKMAALTERAIQTSLAALTGRNRQLAYSIILRDRYIDELETELDRLCLDFLVRHQPVAGQLRMVFATILINRELERIGDYAESIARQVLVLSEQQPEPPDRELVELGDLAVHMLRDAVRSFLEQDAELAVRTIPLEERANSMRTSINAHLQEPSRTGALSSASVTALTTVARRLERVTDQAKNLCEEVLYMCTGEFVRHKSAEPFRILFFDAHNNCLSQMAEGIGAALGLTGFVFNSAGHTPQPVAPRTLDFMAEKGVDLSHQAAKSLEQVPEWEQYQVIVALNLEVQDALALRSCKTILFSWSVPDPSNAEGPVDVVRAAFEPAYQALASRIRELIAAVLQDPQPELKL